jgi:citrate lyase subunit beta / citryl-CoA lyase
MESLPLMSEPTLRLRRSVLYVPAANARAMAKSWSLGADAIVYDLEDAVAPAAKANARAALVAHLAEHRQATTETVIRVNALGTADIEADLEAVARSRPDAVLLPKVGNADDLHDFAQRAARIGVAADTQLWAMVETAAGIAELDAIVKAGTSLQPRLACLVVGTNDIAKETGVFAGDGRAYLMPWLMNIVLVAKRRGISVLDGVWNDFRNQEGFELETLQSMKMGFDGKTLIHPSQVEPANRHFSPSPEAVEDARRIVAIFSGPQYAASNVVNLDGRMVERLHYEQALQLLAIHARTAGTQFGA